MPTYSYRCDSCGHEFDLKQSFSSEPRHECPVCKNTARRRINLPAVIYKGSGFYTTDYARKSDGSSSNGSSPKSSSSESSATESSSSESTSSDSSSTSTSPSSSTSTSD